MLGAAACVGTLAFYDQQDPWMVKKLMAWLALALLGLVLHETRPFRVRRRRAGKGRASSVPMGGHKGCPGGGGAPP